MELDKVFQLFKLMEQENILLSFKGVVTSDLLTSVLQIMESKLNYMDEEKRIKKRVFHVLVECIQNLYHHAEDTEKSSVTENIAMLVISKEKSNFIIKTGNYIDVESSESLSLKLDKINKLDKDGLKQFYLESLSDGNLSQKGTAGLGFIDIARKSGNKLNYEFIPVNEKYHFFSLEIKI